MKDHFLVEENSENMVRYLIFQLMTHYEEMDELLDKLLTFELPETQVLDKLEVHLIEMEKLNIEMLKHFSTFNEAQTIGEEIVLETSSLPEAVRRTSNLLKGLNILDLNKDNWVVIASKCMMDQTTYRRIKALVYNKPGILPKEN